MGYAEGPTARSAPRRICTRSESWELRAVGRMRFQASFVLLTNFARNSPTAVSKIELWSLELQRFWMLLNVHAVELRATFVWLWCCGPCGGLHAGRGGFALHEALWRRVVGVSAPRVVQFPPSWLSSTNFACNSPKRSCLSISVRIAVSLVFWNCMRLCLGVTTAGVLWA